ncbi:MAG: alpha/beta hydrolase [Deltaproteobacteria bacterium]|nr:alpha/beta hydrolase [Deltaproteobacteria bacterium]
MEKKFADVGGDRICYVEGGTGPDLVLVHGFLVSHRVWKDVWGPLTARFHVVAPDLLGHGDSARPDASRTPYDADCLAERVAGLLQHKGIKGAGVVGHSMGGKVSAAMVLRHPELASRLMLLDSVGAQQELPLLGKIVNLPVVGKAIFKHAYNRAVVTSYFKGDVYRDPRRVTPELVDEVYRCLELPHGRDAMYAIFQRTVAPNVTDTADSLKQLKLPVKLIWGEFDKIFPLSAAREFERIITGSTLTVIPGIGHSAPDEAPEKLVEEINTFFGADAAVAPAGASV